MFPLQYATKSDLKELAKIERRRILEEERKRRIFNPRARLIGVDVHALNAQINEKQCEKNREKADEKRFDFELSRRDYELSEQLNRLSIERRRIECEINKFRTDCQRKEFSRDFDLSDPNSLKQSSPARVGDDDPRLGISSAQIFMGEDIQSDERRRQQQLQQKAWLLQQIDEKRRFESARADATRRMSATMNAWNNRIREIDESEQKLRKQMAQNTANFNLELAKEQAATRMREKSEEDKDNRAEMINIWTSDMLSENRELGKVSPLGGKHVVVSQYRGLTDDEIRQIREYQKQQIDESKQRKENERVDDRRYDEILSAQMGQVKNEETKSRAMKLKFMDELTRENIELSEKQRRQQINVLEGPKEEYFAQFNTTTR